MIEEKDCSGLKYEFYIKIDNMDKVQSAVESFSKNIDLMDQLKIKKS